MHLNTLLRIKCVVTVMSEGKAARNEKRIDISIRLDDKIKIMRKAGKMGVSVSRLMVMAALDYEPNCVIR